MLAKAIKIAAEAFENKYDKGGNPYILHCLQVMYDTQSDNKDVKIAAVLHDLLEDCEEWTIERLHEEGFSFRVIELLRLLTKDNLEDYDSYISHIGLDKDAAEIKKADLRHNSQITRMKGLTKKDFDRLKKYSIAYQYLSGL